MIDYNDNENLKSQNYSQNGITTRKRTISNDIESLFTTNIDITKANKKEKVLSPRDDLSKEHQYIKHQFWNKETREDSLFTEKNSDIDHAFDQCEADVLNFDNSLKNITADELQLWITDNFGLLPKIREQSFSSNSGTSVNYLLFDNREMADICLVRLAKIHNSRSGWIEICQVQNKNTLFSLETPLNCSSASYKGQSQVVLKVIDFHRIYGTKLQSSAKNELLIQQKLQGLNQPNKIISLLGCFLWFEKLCLIYPYYSRGDFFDFLSYDPVNLLPEDEVRITFTAMIKDVQICHSAGVAHLDLSLENFLVSSGHAQPVLIDFGISSTMDEKYLVPHVGPRGKLKYMAPELNEKVCGQAFDGRKLDVFSLGVILFMLAMKFEPWESTKSTDEDFHSIILTDTGFESLNLDLSSSLKDLLRRMLAFNPEERPTIEEIFQHDWMKKAF